MFWGNIRFSLTCIIILHTNIYLIVHTYLFSKESPNLTFTSLHFRFEGLLTFQIDRERCSCSIVIKKNHQKYNLLNNCAHSVHLLVSDWNKSFDKTGTMLQQHKSALELHQALISTRSLRSCVRSRSSARYCKKPN